MFGNPYHFSKRADSLDIKKVFDNYILIIFTSDLVKLYFKIGKIEIDKS